MLYNSNLEEIIFNRHEHIRSDELIIVSGYVGPNQIVRLEGLPFHSTVIYGMHGSKSISPRLHNSLVNLQGTIQNVNIYYSKLPVHSKCYVWKNQNEIIHALIGSANFTTSGLTTPYREILAETTTDTFDPLNEYITRIRNNSILCTEATVRAEAPKPVEGQVKTSYCRMTLLDPRTEEVPEFSGLNWGQGAVRGHHTNPDDAYIPIRAMHIRDYPELFPAKQLFPISFEGGGRRQRHNDKIEMIWDDGIAMDGLLEGTFTIDEVIFPKQIASFPEKRTLGLYFRRRLGVPNGARVTRQHLDRYGRTDVCVSLLNEGVYYFDFSVSE
jgi:hypothetical protein